MNFTVQDISTKVEKIFPSIIQIHEEMSKVIVGQKYLIDRLLMGILGDGHILVEGVPGLAKTTTIKTLSEILDIQFGRVQFTPDLLPADLVGTQIYSPKEGQFYVKKGPIFANLILADEINRAPAKVQSALLEAMQEKQVTIGEQTFALPSPFLVMATQNPVEQEGTYPLPEAQLDRFMLKVKIQYPSRDEEIHIMKKLNTPQQEKIHVKKVLHAAKIQELKDLIENIYVDEKIFNYISQIIFTTRFPKQYGQQELASFIEFGASPRASINLLKSAKTFAFLAGRAYVTPQDIKTMALDVLRHRILLTYEAEAQDLTTDDIIIRILDKVEVP
jgi:MoxR-like ATPase